MGWCAMTRKPGICPFDARECLRSRWCAFGHKAEACMNYDRRKRSNPQGDQCRHCVRHETGCVFECLRRDFLKKIRSEKQGAQQCQTQQPR